MNVSGQFFMYDVGGILFLMALVAAILLSVLALASLTLWLGDELTLILSICRGYRAPLDSTGRLRPIKLLFDISMRKPWEPSRKRSPRFPADNGTIGSCSPRHEGNNMREESYP